MDLPDCGVVMPTSIELIYASNVMRSECRVQVCTHFQFSLRLFISTMTKRVRGGAIPLWIVASPSDPTTRSVNSKKGPCKAVASTAKSPKKDVGVNEHVIQKRKPSCTGGAARPKLALPMKGKAGWKRQSGRHKLGTRPGKRAADRQAERKQIRAEMLSGISNQAVQLHEVVMEAYHAGRAENLPTLCIRYGPRPWLSSPPTHECVLHERACRQPFSHICVAQSFCR